MSAADLWTITRWVKTGYENGSTHVVVVCDTYDWTDYPIYVHPGEDINEVINRAGRVMEVYNMSMDMAAQLAERRAWHVEAPTAQV